MEVTQRFGDTSLAKRMLLFVGLAAAFVAIGGLAFYVAKLRPIAAPIVSALEPRSGGSAELVLAIAIPDRCERGELRVRYAESLRGVSVKAAYRRTSILPPADFSCEAILRLSGRIVRIAIRPESGLEIESDRQGFEPKSIMDHSQSVPRPVVYVREFSPEPQERVGPGLEVEIERVSKLD